MAKAEPPRDGGRKDELRSQQLVDEIQRVVRSDVGGACRQGPLEGIPGDCRAVQQAERGADSDDSSPASAARTVAGTTGVPRPAGVLASPSVRTSCSK